MRFAVACKAYPESPSSMFEAQSPCVQRIGSYFLGLRGLRGTWTKADWRRRPRNSEFHGRCLQVKVGPRQGLACSESL